MTFLSAFLLALMKVTTVNEEKEKSLFRYGLDHLQYVLLNIQDHVRTFQRGLKILKEARFLPDP